MTEPEAIAVFTSQSARSASWRAFELRVYVIIIIIIMAVILVCWARLLGAHTGRHTLNPCEVGTVNLPYR